MKPVHVLALIAGTFALAGLTLAPFHATAALFYVIPIVLIVCWIMWTVGKGNSASRNPR